MNLKIPGKMFLLITFFKYLKYLRQSFKYLKKANLQILKHPIHANNNFKGNNLHKKEDYTNNSRKKPL